MRPIFKMFVSMLLLVVHLWCVGAICFCAFPGDKMATQIAIAMYVVVALAIFAKSYFSFKGFFNSLFIVFPVIIWFVTIQPPENALYPAYLDLARADIGKDAVKVYGVRNLDYRTLDDFIVYYEDKEYDLTKLNTLDILFNYWGKDQIAHTFLSFGFSDGQQLAVSIEIRPEVGEDYDMLAGFFKQYEIVYIWGDERDLVRVRTNFKDEDVRLYRVNMKQEEIHSLLISMLSRTNDLHEKQQFYNTLTESCTNTIGDHLKKTGIYYLPSWESRIFSGKVELDLYDRGLIRNDIAFDELRSKSNIVKRAKLADKDSDFSVKIRTHLLNR